MPLLGTDSVVPGALKLLFSMGRERGKERGSSVKERGSSVNSEREGKGLEYELG